MKVIITGTTGMIGEGVLLECLNQPQITEVLSVSRRPTGIFHPKHKEYIVADLFSLADTKRMAEEIKTRYKQLDVLINNAGGFLNKKRELTSEGLEKTIALNLFAPFLLMNSLLEVMANSKSARIINLSSAMHRSGGKPDFNDFQTEKNYSPARAYGLSKLYLIWITRHMAKQLKEKGINNITVNASHPGAVATNFGQDSDKGFVINLVFKIALIFMDKPEDGARTSIYLASSPEVENISGEFFNNKCKLEKPDDRFYTSENEKKVWDYCQQITMEN